MALNGSSLLTHLCMKFTAALIVLVCRCMEPSPVTTPHYHRVRYLLICADQVPLKLAWCLTIHKIQGASLDYVSVDLEGCFETGQAYVALSRARSDNGLSVKNFRAQVVRTDAVAKNFHDAVSRDTVAGGRDDSAVAAMLAELPPWWHVLLQPDNQDYLRLFMRSDHFQRLHAAHYHRSHCGTSD
jgi:hypothetical protein